MGPLTAKDGNNLRGFFTGLNNLNNRSPLKWLKPPHSFIKQRLALISFIGQVSGEHQSDMAYIILQFFSSKNQMSKKTTIMGDNSAGKILKSSSCCKKMTSAAIPQTRGVITRPSSAARPAIIFSIPRYIVPIIQASVTTPFNGNLYLKITFNPVKRHLNRFGHTLCFSYTDLSLNSVFTVCQTFRSSSGRHSFIGEIVSATHTSWLRILSIHLLQARMQCSSRTILSRIRPIQSVQGHPPNCLTRSSFIFFIFGPPSKSDYLSSRNLTKHL